MQPQPMSKSSNSMLKYVFNVIVFLSQCIWVGCVVVKLLSCAQCYVNLVSCYVATVSDKRKLICSCSLLFLLSSLLK